MINITINEQKISVKEGTSILDAAKTIGVKIPTLCHLKLEDLGFEHSTGSCRICVVEVEGRPNLAPSCCTPAYEGMVVKTNSIRAINGRRTMLDLILSNHPKECLTCGKSGDCTLQDLASSMGMHRVRYEGEQTKFKIDIANESIVRDMNKCIMCRKCEVVCTEIQTVGILTGVNRGFEASVGTASDKGLDETKCTFCGQCVSVCPVGALTAINRSYDVIRYLNDPKKTVIVQTAPAVRVAIGEPFGLEPGVLKTGQMVSALQQLGFDKVFDTDFAADLTIMEEATELLERVKKGENLPILTSCCPGWVKFFEHQFPELLNIPSSAKSPQQMFGAIAKSYYAEKIGVKPEDLIVVSVMPCLAKKHEAARDEFAVDGVRDVDVVISTRELAMMVKEAGIDLVNLPEAEYDNPLGESTGAGVIFGSSGGVLEAALRTAADWISGEDLKEIDFTPVRGLTGIREAEVDIKGTKIKVAVTSGLGNTRKLLERIKDGTSDYTVIEVMACPGGCLNGGGQPYVKQGDNTLEKRKKAIYAEDTNKTIRKSHHNPDIIKLYDEFLGKPGSKLAHKLLHTSYEERANW